MKEDYLWDKSGDVDAEIEELENVLGRLRYQRPAQPLPLPAVSRPWWRLNSKLLAAAAAVVLLLLAGGVMLRLHHNSIGEVASGVRPSPTPGPVDPIGNQATVTEPPKIEEVNPPAPENIGTPRAPVQRNRFIQVKYKEPRSLRDEQFIRKGEQAKEQLIKALLITSEKLNVAQKKIQGSHDVGPIS